MAMRRSVVRLSIILVIAWGGIAYSFSTGHFPLLGLDLRGGVEALLTSPPGTDPEVLDVAVDVLRARIEGIGNVQEPEITVVGDSQNLDVLVQLPGVENLDEALNVLGQTGQLSFRPVYDEQLPDGSSAVDVFGPCPAVYQLNDQAFPAPPVAADGFTTPDDPTQPAWLPVRDDTGVVTAKYLVGPAQLMGTGIADALAQLQGTSAIDAGWSVSLTLNAEGEGAFNQLTKDAASCQPSAQVVHPSRRIAIVHDGEILTAPPVASSVDPGIGISGGRASIGIGGTDDAAAAEAAQLTIVLRYGALPISLAVGNVEKVSATLGADSLQSGITAGLIGLALVAIVLLAYYRSLGIIAVVGLSVFGSMLILSYTLLGQLRGLSLTLAGVTGIVVSVGITADSYIVYFERIKEELHGGAPMYAAVSEGFKKAYRTILTADFVTLLGAFLLYTLAVDRVKGFALALGVATLLDLLVAKWFTRHAVMIMSETKMGEGGAFSIRGFAGE